MTWLAAMRWARVRAADTGMRHRVCGYALTLRDMNGAPFAHRWGYMVRRTDIPITGCRCGACG